MSKLFQGSYQKIQIALGEGGGRGLWVNPTPSLNHRVNHRPNWLCKNITVLSYSTGRIFNIFETIKAKKYNLELLSVQRESS
jgi:hypothetical protein